WPRRRSPSTPRSRGGRAPASDCSYPLAPLQATDAERAAAASCRVLRAVPSTSSGLLQGNERAAREEIFLEMRIHLRIPPPVPLEQHGEVLLLLVAVVA